MSCKPRFLSLTQVQRELALTRSQVTALIQTGALSAFQILGEWRIEGAMLDSLVDRQYEEASARLAAGSADASPDPRPVDITAGITVVPVRDPAAKVMTAQQQRIVRLVAEGLSNAEVAKHLSLEVSTVKSHVSRVLQRLNLRSRQQLIAHLWRTGFIDGSAPGVPDLIPNTQHQRVG